MGTIRLNNIRSYAFHGCLTEEGKIGSEYRIDLEVEADLSRSAETDELQDTVDYVKLNAIVKDEMEKRSYLLEHVADRILTGILNEVKMVKQARITVSKINPPLGGDVENVSVSLSKKRE